MGSRSLAFAFLALAFVASARADLQFTPKIVEVQADGVKSKAIVFSDGGGKDITYLPPTGWNYSGNAT